MPQKTKAQLREELEAAKQELAEVRAELGALRESERRLKKSEEQLKEDVEELRRQAAESDRELTEAMVELSLAQDKVESLEGSLRGEANRRVRLASPTDSTTDFDPRYSEVGSLIRLHEIEEARDDALDTGVLPPDLVDN